MRDYVSEGRYEILHGGAVSADEATVSVHDMIDNMFVSRHWVQKVFGLIPNIGWQLDAFGHSVANARIFAELGIEALVFARMPNDKLQEWALQKQKDFVWRPEFATTSEESPALFTHVLFDHYSAPDGFNYFNGGSKMRDV